jgi:hypothetical protein
VFAVIEVAAAIANVNDATIIVKTTNLVLAVIASIRKHIL